MESNQYQTWWTRPTHWDARTLKMVVIRSKAVQREVESNQYQSWWTRPTHWDERTLKAVVIRSKALMVQVLI